ncbi:hypothetical protein TREMEDRAFT_41668 [Tremella mesenterica DSM 1558]|uniref:uncharacterized protein n=1 Tax=Tremella mesenterica (strain ATCC 24925 / CBS 8224 / DSM 1558 / NBRC 9311 / NRRL Y-6157 / RJB 2259-6 / UBC 559-6) TaxID=578456 RepID=UPI0003F49F79|nr:uncharacterized protein TREMEDRAFT_41668 [Tremella mesenterica DSM 1558]EIW72342.1 hypothetical protein TREMEDRAFT_41668 [Tremella mesenterica DSM 1558]
MQNGHQVAEQPYQSRTHNAEQFEELLDAVREELTPFIRAADQSSSNKHALSSSRTLVNPLQPRALTEQLDLDLPQVGTGTPGLLQAIQDVLRGSVNTWDQGFMDKLYASTNPVGVISELVLAVLNTNVHVYHVSPALTLIEKKVSRALADLFGFNGPHGGGISQPGGSASNMSSIIVARNTLFPHTKKRGLVGLKPVLFTSAHGHYSLEKAAQIMGFGSDACRSVSCDEDGRMIPSELRRQIKQAIQQDEAPFYVNATAGTTVLGSFDPLEAIADICEEFHLWMHVDGSWGGSVVFNSSIGQGRLDGIHRANSITISPHKMLGVPITCSFLLGRDMRQFHRAMTLPAAYLFHEDANEDGKIYDLADLTPQCGRKGDALKVYLSWTFYGAQGYSDRIARAYARADDFVTQLEKSPNTYLVSRRPLPCLQVCFYYTPGRLLSDNVTNSRRTEDMVRRLLHRGFMIDFASGKNGKFIRVVINGDTLPGTVEALLECIEEEGNRLLDQEMHQGLVL